MGVIDFHTHPYRPTDLAPATWTFIQKTSRYVAEHGEQLNDPRYVAQLLRNEGVDYAVVLPEHCPATSGHVRTETVLELCAQVPDFFLPFASVDINSDPDPAGLLNGYIKRGVRGLKLYPSYQFYYSNDLRLYPLYDACQAAGIPVLLHIGSSVIPGTRIKFCNPIHLDDVAVDFPDLTIVMAHGGRGFWYDVCAFLAQNKENVYIDVTGLVPARLAEHFPELEKLSHKVVFGSDWPAMPKSVQQNAGVIGALPLSREAQSRILRTNAARILRIED